MMKDDFRRPAGEDKIDGQESCRKLCVQVIDLLSGLDELNISDDERRRRITEAETGPNLTRQ